MTVCFLQQDQLELLVKDNEQLKFEVRELLNSSTLASSSRDQGEITFYCIIGPKLNPLSSCIYVFMTIIFNSIVAVLFHIVYFERN